jgi:prepilin signal peptidase PulO-like enzyme (type II secretory pathway)
MITVMIIVLLVVFGLCLGSFVNALVWRLHKQDELAEAPVKKKTAKQPSAAELSIVKGRSMCSHCHHPLAAEDLIPVISWLSLRGKCRYCHKPIPDTPVSELLVPALFILSYLAWPESLIGAAPAHIAHFVVWLLVLVGFVALFLYDLRWYLLPNKIVYPLVVLSGAWAAYNALTAGSVWHQLLALLGALVVSSGIFYALYQLSDGRWIGGGDVKLGLAIGFLVGTPLHGFLVLFIASVLGTVVALPGLLTGKMHRTSKLPFGPFLMTATVIVVLYGDHFVHTYLRLLGA